MNKKELQRQESNKRIVEAALVEFSKNNYQVATLTDIAVRADVSKGLVTLRFGSKGGLFLELMKMLCDKELVFPEKEDKIKNFNEAIISVVAYSKYLALEKPLVAKFLYRFLDCIEFIPEDSRDIMKEHVMSHDSMKFFETEAKAGRINKHFDGYGALCLFMINCLSLSISTVNAEVEFLPDKDYLFMLPLITVPKKKNIKKQSVK
ncbi:MAG: TetR/AcrR family transcriptional regulator [Lachnospiraceae bacterium]|nr:TetR/AcrR family transcriptional regulator [Lachnospiraceae bacterium]